jgi:hypothetical protein
MPQPPHLLAEARKRGMVAADAIEGIMPTHFLAELAMLLRHRLVAVLLTPLRNTCEGGPELLALGLALYRPTSAPGAPPVMGEAEEVEGLRLSSLFQGWRKSTIRVFSGCIVSP